jgi:hypothetical protein
MHLHTEIRNAKQQWIKCVRNQAAKLLQGKESLCNTLCYSIQQDIHQILCNPKCHQHDGKSPTVGLS